jgi:hypothetical protein
MPYQCLFLLLHHSLDVASIGSGAGCVFNPPNLLVDLLWCNVHVLAQGPGVDGCRCESKKIKINNHMYRSTDITGSNTYRQIQDIILLIRQSYH